MSKEKFMVEDGKIKSEAEVAKVPVKKREENLTERFERLHHAYDGGPKPKHYDDESIVDQEKWRSMSGLEKKTPVMRPKPFKNNDPATYPSNQKKRMGTWEVMMKLAKNPKNRDDRLQAGEVRKTIMKSFKDPVMRKYLGDDELKLIGKHPSQRKSLEVTPVVTPAAPIVKPEVPVVPVEERIKRYVDNKKQQQIQNLENRYGRGGLMTALKDLI
tara:strand:- start:629 stop:1273 length:645 start_codon:yes stop_codon:yes gene_type:complete